jgi:histidinol-phosphate/aromatic aminotransferase/cobyric acid decarboxylase-like protein
MPMTGAAIRRLPGHRNSAAVAGWLGRRYGLPAGAVDADRAILPVQGTREALFQIATVAAQHTGRDDAAVLFPNTSYATYAAAGHLAGAEAVPLSTRAETASCPISTARPGAAGTHGSALSVHPVQPGRRGRQPGLPEKCHRAGAPP